MSLDIDWSLLGPADIQTHLVSLLNASLANAPRPSFIGPISVTSFDLGTEPPEVEIRDIRDVWRAFDEGDDDGDAEVIEAQDAAAASVRGEEWTEQRELGVRSRFAQSRLDDDGFELLNHPQHPGLHRHTLSRYTEEPEGMEGLDGMEGVDGMDRENQSVRSGSGFSPRNSIAAVGIGIGSALHGLGGGGRDYGSGILSPVPPSLLASSHTQLYGNALRRQSQQLYPHQSQSHIHSRAPSAPASAFNAFPNYNSLPYSHTNTHAQARSQIHGRDASHAPQLPSHTTQATPASPPRRPPNTREDKSSIPSLQLHLRVSHSSNLSLTILTSLSINYPSLSFMTLPLKLSITGLALAADVVVAYSSQKHRVHICVVDEDPDGPSTAPSQGSNGFGPGPVQTPALGPGPPRTTGRNTIPIGQRLLPHLSIDSEIGQADAHVLKNVGKVERFIADVVRKTLVDELVFPNFQTIAL